MGVKRVLDRQPPRVALEGGSANGDSHHQVGIRKGALEPSSTSGRVDITR